MRRFILALDQGTSSSRAILFDHAGQIAGLAQQPFPQLFPQPGWVEHDANAIWQSQISVAHQVMREQNVNATDIAAVGIANQRETTVIWDRQSGQPIAPAIVWQDRRTATLCETMRANGLEPLFQKKTGLLLDAYFSATKIKWLLEHIPDAQKRAQRGELAFGTIDSWLLYKLCGKHVTDISNAARTLLFDIHTLKWDNALLDAFSIPHNLLPEVVPNSGMIGHTHTAHFGRPIPVTGVAGDQQAATFGQSCFSPGMAKNTYGTGCFLLLNTGTQARKSHHNLLTTIGWRCGQDAEVVYMQEGSVFMGGAVIQWLRDGLGIISRSDQVEQLAKTVTDTDGVLLVPAFNGLGAPYWDPHARGLLIGMTRGTEKAHIARAALESIALQCADLMHAMQKDAITPLNELRVDGAAARNDLLMQFQADILGTVVTRPVVTETTALGAAWLAGLGIGFWSGLDEIAAQWKIERRFEPNMSPAEREERLAYWHRAIERAKKWDEPTNHHVS